MSFEDAAQYLGCSVSDFCVQDSGVGNLLCLVCSGDSVNAAAPAIAEVDVARKQIRLRFTTSDAFVCRINWMLVLSEP